METVYRIPTGDGSLNWFNLQQRSVQLREENATLLYFRNLQPLVDMVAAKQSERQKEMVVATSSHELRTPLNGILTMLMLIIQSGCLEEIKHYAKVAHSTAELMLSLVNDMLDFSRIVMRKFVKKEAVHNVRE